MNDHHKCEGCYYSMPRNEDPDSGELVRRAMMFETTVAEAIIHRFQRNV